MQRRGRSSTAAGEQVGDHDGAYAFTVGQRRGLRIGRPAADGRPRYVLDVSPVTNTVTVGLGRGPRRGGADRDPPAVERTGPVRPVECLAQVRAHGEAVPAVAWCGDAGEDVQVELRRPMRGVAPGQAVVLYDGDVVIGSATIASTR